LQSGVLLNVFSEDTKKGGFPYREAVFYCCRPYKKEQISGHKKRPTVFRSAFLLGNWEIYASMHAG
jgi:hypothetical protein